MKEALPQKMFYYFDESGDPKILGHRGKNLLQEGLVSKTFSVGYVEMLSFYGCIEVAKFSLYQKYVFTFSRENIIN